MYGAVCEVKEDVRDSGKWSYIIILYFLYLLSKRTVN